MGENVAHTPGPWEACERGYYSDVAPELLEALKLCVENIQGIADEKDIPSTAIRDFARATIAKAEVRLITSSDRIGPASKARVSELEMEKAVRRDDKIKSWIEELDAILADTKETLRAGASRHGDSFAEVAAEPLERIEQARHLLFSLPYRESIEGRSDYLMPDNEDFRQGYSVGYAHAYGDISDLKAKLDERKRAIALLTAQNDWLKDRLSDLQLSPRDPRNIEAWLVECGMPAGGDA